jgi:hypothetical protein
MSYDRLENYGRVEEDGNVFYSIFSESAIIVVETNEMVRWGKCLSKG